MQVHIAVLLLYLAIYRLQSSHEVYGRKALSQKSTAVSTGQDFTAIADVDAFPLEEVDWARLQALYAALIDCTVRHSEPLDAVFYGDSITESLRGTVRGKPHKKAADIPAIWDKHFGSWQALPLGIAGDRTVNLLWRIKEGGESPEGLVARSVILQVGTNDFYNHYRQLWGATPMSEVTAIVSEISAGIIANAAALRRRQPKAHIVLLALFPRGNPPPSDDPENYNHSWPSMFAPHIVQINQRLEDFAAAHHGFTFLDCGHVFVMPAARGINPELMLDGLHPTAKGMDLLLDCLKPHLLRPTHHRRNDGAGWA